MSRVEVRVTRFSKLNNAPVSLIFVNGDLEPQSAAYLLGRLDRGSPLSNITLRAHTIKLFFEYCLEHQLDFPVCFKRMEHLPSGTLEHLSAFFSIRRDTGDVVSEGTFRYRWSHIKGFLMWVWRFYQERLTDSEALKAAQVKQSIMLESLKEYGTFGYRADKKDRIGLTPDLKADFFNIIHPGEHNKLNPWRSKLVRWRNYCLFLTMILGSNRKGESLNLKVRDFSLTGPVSQDRYYEFKKTSTVTSPYGTRKQKPALKTKGRRVIIGPDLARIFEHYITDIRSKFKGSKKYDNMFLSFRDGEPISINTPNEALKELIAKHPQFKGKLSPHLLRNTWADSVRDALDKMHEHHGPLARQGIVSAAMEYGGGWTRGSKQVDSYPKGTIERRMAEVHLLIQERIYNEVMNGSNG